MRDDVEWNGAVRQMPGMGLWHDFAVGKLAYLVANRCERLVKAGFTDGDVVVSANQLDQTAALIAAGDKTFERAGYALDDRRGHEPEIGRAHKLTLAHRNTARDLGKVFAEADPDQEFLQLAQGAGIVHPLGIGRELADRFNIGREPGQAVGGALLAFEQALHGMDDQADALAHGGRRIPEQRFNRKRGLAGQDNQLEPGAAPISLGQHRPSPSASIPGRPSTPRTTRPKRCSTGLPPYSYSSFAGLLTI